MAHHYEVCTECWEVKCNDCDYHPFSKEETTHSDEPSDPCNECIAFEKLFKVSRKCLEQPVPPSASIEFQLSPNTFYYMQQSMPATVTAADDP